MLSPASLQPAAEAFVPTFLLVASPRVEAGRRPVVPRSAVSATLLTKNSQGRLEEVLAALAWCDEVVVFDTGSTDRTWDIAGRFPNVSLHRLAGDFPGFGLVRQAAVERARNDWILAVDSDEVVSAQLADEITSLRLDPGAVYEIPFHNYFNGRLITSCGWHCERHERLFNRARTNFCASHVHERVRTAGLTVRRLRHPIRHYSYEGTDDFLRKMHHYSRLFAAQGKGRKSSSPLRAVTRSAWAFAKSYFLQRGILQGYEGLVISAYKAQTVFWKYLMLHEANGGTT